MSRKVKVISDGSSYGTLIITPNGDKIVAMNVRFSHNAGEIPIVTLDLIGVEFEGVLPIGSAE